MKADKSRAIGASAALVLACMLTLAPAAAAETRTVTSSADSGEGSLRAAIDGAAAGDVIEIGAGVNPVLTSGEIVVDTNLTIRGSSASATAVSAGNTSRIFRISGATVTIEDLALTGGRAARGADGSDGVGGSAGEDGGAILNQASANLTLSRVTIVNSAAGDGGNGGNTVLPILGPGAGGAGGHGGAVASFGTLAIEASTLASNRGGTGGAPGTGGLNEAAGGAGGNGGAIYVSGGLGRTTTLENVTLTANAGGNGTAGAAAGRGGGIFAEGGGGPGAIIVSHATIAGNGAGTGAGQAGGGIAAETAGAALVVQNSILAANTAGSGANCSGASIGDGGNNIAFSGDGCAAGFADIDPRLDPDGPADNGGPTPTIAIVGAASAALNQVAASGENCAARDQRGVLRPQGARCDIGAFEIKAPSCNDFTATTRPGRVVTVKLTCSGPGIPALALKSEPTNGELSKFKAEAGTVNFRAGRRFRGTDTFTYSGTNFVGESAPATVTVTVAGPFPPPNDFRFGKVKLNRNKGTAKLVVRVPGPGKLRLSGKGARNVKRKAKKKGKVSLPVKPAKKVRKKLRRRGVATVRAQVRYKPRGGFTRKRTKKVRLRVNNFFVPL